MSHAQQLFYVGNIQANLGEYFRNKKVLEIGSLDINGSVRTFFTDCDYTGLDVGEGKNVDIVCPGEDYGAASSTFDVVISCEAMEHNREWRKTWLNMLRMLKPDGLLIMTCATPGRRQHGTEEFLPADSPLTISSGRSYYKNLTAADFDKITPFDEWFSLWSSEVDHSAHDMYFYGLGTEAPEHLRNAGMALKNAFQQHYYNKNVLGVY